MGAPGFWDDQKKAQAVNRKRSMLEQQINSIEKLVHDVEEGGHDARIGSGFQHAT